MITTSYGNDSDEYSSDSSISEDASLSLPENAPQSLDSISATVTAIQHATPQRSDQATALNGEEEDEEAGEEIVDTPEEVYEWSEFEASSGGKEGAVTVTAPVDVAAKSNDSSQPTIQSVYDHPAALHILSMHPMLPAWVSGDESAESNAELDAGSSEMEHVSSLSGSLAARTLSRTERHPLLSALVQRLTERYEAGSAGQQSSQRSTRTGDATVTATGATELPSPNPAAIDSLITRLRSNVTNATTEQPKHVHVHIKPTSRIEALQVEWDARSQAMRHQHQHQNSSVSQQLDKENRATEQGASPCAKTLDQLHPSLTFLTSQLRLRAALDNLRPVSPYSSIQDKLEKQGRADTDLTFRRCLRVSQIARPGAHASRARNEVERTSTHQMQQLDPSLSLPPCLHMGASSSRSAIAPDPLAQTLAVESLLNKLYLSKHRQARPGSIDAMRSQQREYEGLLHNSIRTALDSYRAANQIGNKT